MARLIDLRKFSALPVHQCPVQAHLGNYRPGIKNVSQVLANGLPERMNTASCQFLAAEASIRSKREPVVLSRSGIMACYPV